MDKETVEQQVEILIETIDEQFTKIKMSSGKVSQIEMDILLSNIRDMYEFCSLLNEMNNRNTTPSVQNIKPVTEETTKNRTVEEKEELVKTPVSEKKEETKKTIDNVPEEVKVQPVKALHTPIVATASLFDEDLLVKEVEGTVHDKISKDQKEDKSVADNLKKKPIKDMKAAIGINEKFLFINELFEGSLQEYNTAIEYLNNCGNFREAETHLESGLSIKYKWEKKSKYVQSFFELVERRFI